MSKLKMDLYFPCLLCAVVFLLPAMPADDGAEPARNANAAPQHEQTQGGVTVRIEKITLERVTNAPAWFRKQYDKLHWRKIVHPDVPTDSFRIIRVFISETGPAKERRMSFELGGDARIGSDGVAEFDPDVWGRQLPDLDVDPKARGIIFWTLVKDKASREELFPGKAKLDVTTESGEKVRFEFNHLTL